MRVVLLAHARPAIVLAAGGERGGVELVDLLPRLGAKGNMKMRRLAAGGDPEERLAFGPDAAV